MLLYVPLRFVVALVAVLLLSAPVSAQLVFFVDADATGANDGTSWTDAFSDLQDALAVVEAGDEVWVAEGTYYPDDGEPVDRDASFVLVSGTALYGGFDGTETSLDQRDVEANVTVLSGDLGVPDDETDNAYHVVTASGVDETTVLDGFTVTAGYANGLEPRNRGAGLYAVGGSPQVRNCRIVENTVIQTDGNGGGGGAFFGDSGQVVFERVVFDRNAGGIGGGLWLVGEFEPRSEESLEAEMRRQAEAELLGEVAPVVNDSQPEVLSAVLRGVDFTENMGSFGGGMRARRAEVDIVEARFERNFASAGAGGLRFSSTDAHLLNVEFYGNTVNPDDLVSVGGGMQISGGVYTLTNVTFVGNTSRIGAALAHGGGGMGVLTGVSFVANEAVDGNVVLLASGAQGRLHNSVLWNGGAEVEASSGEATLDHVLIEGGCPAGNVSCEAILDTDPRFMRDPDPGLDETWGTPDDDYGNLRLQEDSPAIDFGLLDFLPPDTFDLDRDGDTTEPLPFDLAGGLRVVEAEIDLGAYERQPPVAVEPKPLASDLRLAVYPNPSAGPVTVAVRLGQAHPVEVALFDVLGREVAVLHEGPLAAGGSTLRFKTARVPAGVYVLRAVMAPAAGGSPRVFSQKLTVLR